MIILLKVRVFLDGKEVKEKDKDEVLIVNTKVNKILKDLFEEDNKIAVTV